MDWTCRSLLLVWAVLALPANAIQAQQVTVGAPIVGVSDGFSENIGVGFGFRLPGGAFFNNGGPNALNGGAGLHIGGPNGFLNLAADQGSTRSISAVSPSVTVMNGGTGAIYDVTVRPYIIGFTPVVGGLTGPAFSQFGPMPLSDVPGPTMLEERLAQLQEQGGANAVPHAAPLKPAVIQDDRPLADPLAAKLAAARQSTAGQPTQSIAAIRRKQAEEDATQARELAEILNRARQAEAAKNTGLARVYYQQALKRAAGEQRAEIEASLRSLGNSTKQR